MTPAEFSTATAGIAYAPRGVFFSELHLFVSLCRSRGVTRIIESGVFGGVSTRVFRALWPDRVASIDYKPEHLPPDLVGDVTVGDGCVLVPKLVDLYRSETVGVFLDGPKGAAAVLLREWCLRQPHVRVVAQHDSPLGSGEVAHSYTTREVSLDDRIDPAIRVLYEPTGCPGMGVWVAA